MMTHIVISEGEFTYYREVNPVEIPQETVDRIQPFCTEVGLVAYRTEVVPGVQGDPRSLCGLCDYLSQLMCRLVEDGFTLRGTILFITSRPDIIIAKFDGGGLEIQNRHPRELLEWCSLPSQTSALRIS